MSGHTDHSDRIAAALDVERSADYDSIDVRQCSNDQYNGVEYAIRGNFIPQVPIVELFEGINGHAIAELNHVDEGDPRLLVFVADLTSSGEISSPAFV